MEQGWSTAVVESVLHYLLTWAFAVTDILVALGWGFNQALQYINVYIYARLSSPTTSSFECSLCNANKTSMCLFLPSMCLFPCKQPNLRISASDTGFFRRELRAK